MKEFIKNILSFDKPGIYGKEECLFVNANFVLVKDHKMIDDNEQNLHLTAWCKNINVKSLKDLNSNYIIHLKEIKSKVIDIIKTRYSGFNNLDIFIHYPPQFWQLHIHFRNKSLAKTSPKNEIFYLKDVIKQLENTNFKCFL